MLVLLEAAQNARNEPDFAPAFLAADSIIPRAEKKAFDQSYWGQKPEEAQGYFDAVSMFVAATMAALVGAKGVKFTLEAEEILKDWPQFALIPEPMRSRTRLFVLGNPGLASQITSSDLTGGRQFMGLLIESAVKAPASPAYQRGVRAARDTLLLHVDLIVTSLSGKFSGN